jgi:hypothetical protein
MVNVYLFIELLRTAKCSATVDVLKALELGECTRANVVALADDKLVAQLDCKTGALANAAIFEKITPVEGIVQTNIIAAVRPPTRVVLFAPVLTAAEATVLLSLAIVEPDAASQRASSSSVA